MKKTSGYGKMNTYGEYDINPGVCRRPFLIKSHKTPRIALAVLIPKGDIAAAVSYLHFSVGAAEAMARAHVTTTHFKQPYLTIITLSILN